MFGSNHGGYLYVFDYGDFVKLGHTIKLRDRLYLFDRNVEEKINMESSYYYKFPREIAMALERSLLHKYKSFAIGHEASKREILDAGVRDLISDDVESYLKIFNLQEKREPLTDTLIGFYENDSLKLKFTKMIKSDNYKAAY